MSCGVLLSLLVLKTSEIKENEKNIISCITLPTNHVILLTGRIHYITGGVL